MDAVSADNAAVWPKADEKLLALHFSAHDPAEE